MNHKERLAQVVKQLREAAKLQDPTAKAAIEMVQLSAIEAKESLVSADGDDMLRVQGAARQLSKLHKELTTTPPNIMNQEPTNNG